MRRIVPILLICLALLSVPHSAQASATATSISLTCSSFTATGTTTNTYLDLQVYSPNVDVFRGFSAPTGVATGTIYFPHQPEGTLLEVLVYSGNNPQGYWDLSRPYYDVTIPCHDNTSSVTWFNPGDGRIDGQPGDRIAVWCNTSATPPNIVVYGVGDNATNGSHGFWLATFNIADLMKASKAGITKNAGAGNGTVSAQEDGSGNFYVAWNGGIFNATGQGDFAKSFACGS